MADDRPSFHTIPRLLIARGSSDWVTMYWSMMPEWLQHRAIASGIDLSPIFQRDRVWSQTQKTKYLEFRLSGGNTSKDIHWNTASSTRAWDEPLLLMDGKQRIDAVLEFLDDRVPVFGHLFSEYSGTPDSTFAQFHFHTHNFQDPDDILRWYIDMNRGGVVHSDDEIERVRALLGKHDRLESTPEERLAELSRYRVLGLDSEHRYMLGAHLCGAPGIRKEIKNEYSFWRWEGCEACNAIYAERHPPGAPTPPVLRAGGSKRGKVPRKRR